MNLLKPIVSEIHDLLIESNLNETIDLRITNLENYDYQINNFVKYQNHPDIKTIKEKVSKALNSSELVKEFEFEKNLFINLKINAELIVTDLANVNKRILSTNREEVIIDYGGPNIGKPLHVGHLRPLNIGRSIYNINKVVGNKVYSDIHLGDWGMPVAQIITYCELEDLKLDDISIEMLEEIYPNASTKYKTEKNLKKKLKKQINYLPQVIR
jgi:arginyl-tRNA synthetase